MIFHPGLSLIILVYGMNNHGTMIKAIFIGFFGEWSHLLHDLRWIILLAILLILTDLWFGVRDNVYVKGEEFRFSRCGRRTFNKTIDYICYVLLGATLGKAIAEPYGVDPIITAITIMIFCYGFELDSIYGHICSIHGVHPPFSLWEFLLLLITLRWKTLVSGLIDLKDQFNQAKIMGTSKKKRYYKKHTKQ